MSNKNIVIVLSNLNFITKNQKVIKDLLHYSKQREDVISNEKYTNDPEPS